MRTEGETEGVFGVRRGLYERVSTQFPTVRASELDAVRDLVASIPKGARILDIGCGTGFLSSFLISSGFIVDGIDFEFPRPSGLRRYWQEDLRKSFPSDVGVSAYGAILSLATMHHIAPVGTGAPSGTLLKRLLQALHPGGELIVIDVCGSDGPLLLENHCSHRVGRFFRDVIDCYAFPPHKGSYLNQADTIRAMQDAGFVEAAHMHIGCPWRFRDHAAMCGFVKTLFNLIDLPDDELADRLEDAIGTRRCTAGYLELDWGLQAFVARRSLDTDDGDR